MRAPRLRHLRRQGLQRARRSTCATGSPTWSTSSATPAQSCPRPTSTSNELEVVLGKPIARLNADKGFDHWFEVYRGTLPSPQMRWCTKKMKIKPLEEWIGDDRGRQLRRDPRGREEPQGLRLHEAEHHGGLPLHRGRHRSRRRHADPRRGRRRSSRLLRMAHPLRLLLLLLPAQGRVGGVPRRPTPELFERAVAIERKTLRMPVRMATPTIRRRHERPATTRGRRGDPRSSSVAATGDRGEAPGGRRNRRVKPQEHSAVRGTRGGAK